MTFELVTKRKFRRKKGPLSEKLFNTYIQSLHTSTGGFGFIDGGPETCSSNILTVSFGYTFTSAPKVIIQGADTSSNYTPQTITTTTFIASSSGASAVFNWFAYGA